MRKPFILILSVLFSATISKVSLSPSILTKADTNTLYIGGLPAGFTLSLGGIEVIGLNDVMSSSGVCSPARSAGIKTGDIITSFCGINVDSLSQISELLSKNGEKTAKIEVKRDGNKITLDLTPAKDKVSGQYKIGVLIRDSVSGIGTVTYFNKETNTFGALGHPVMGENNDLMCLAEGTVCLCSIYGIQKGSRGKAGELKGIFKNEEKIGVAYRCNECGIFGQTESDFDYSTLEKAEICSICDVKMGCVYIYSTVAGEELKKYEAEIVKVDKNNKQNKNYVLHITDEDLISKTGGIVQGMSGSPIVQNGRIIGAVTHVFLNDPTRGYGISIEKMLSVE